MTARFTGLDLIRSNIFDARQGRFSRVSTDGKFHHSILRFADRRAFCERSLLGRTG